MTSIVNMLAIVDNGNHIPKKAKIHPMVESEMQMYGEKFQI